MMYWNSWTRSTSAPPARRRLTTRVVAALTALSATLLAGCSAGTSADDTTTIVMGDSFNLTHPIGVGGTKNFIDALESDEAKKLGIQLEYYANGQMGNQRDMLDLIRSGVVDIAAVSPAYVGPQLQLSNVGDLPGFVTDSCSGAAAIMDLFEEGGILYEKEWAPRGAKVLWPAVIPGYEAMTGSREVTKPSDLKGSVLRSTGGAADRAVTEVGAAGVSMPLGEMYEAISRKTVDGTLASPISIASYRLGEVLGHSTSGARFGAFTVTYAISLDVWNSLNPQQQEFFDRISAQAQQGTCSHMEAALEEGLDGMREDGVQIHEVTEGERSAWDALAEPVVDDWADSLADVGLDAHTVVTEYTDALERHRNDS